MTLTGVRLSQNLKDASKTCCVGVKKIPSNQFYLTLEVGKIQGQPAKLPVFHRICTYVSFNFVVISVIVYIKNEFKDRTWSGRAVYDSTAVSEKNTKEGEFLMYPKQAKNYRFKRQFDEK